MHTPVNFFSQFSQLGFWAVISQKLRVGKTRRPDERKRNPATQRRMAALESPARNQRFSEAPYPIYDAEFPEPDVKAICEITGFS